MLFSTKGLSVPPLPLLSKVAVTLPSPPGGITSFVQSGVVQPQDASTFEIESGPLPTFLNLKTCCTLSPSLMFPKSKVVSTNLKSPLGPLLLLSGLLFTMSSVSTGLLVGVHATVNAAMVEKSKNVFLM